MVLSPDSHWACSIVVIRVHGMDESGVRSSSGPQNFENLPCGRFSKFVETAAMPRKRAGPRGAGCENSEWRRGIICSHKRFRGAQGSADK